MMLTGNFLHDLLAALFPPLVVLLIAGLVGSRNAWANPPAAQLWAVAVIVPLALRAFFAVGGVPVSTRYFLGIAALCLPLAAAGLMPLANWLANAWNRLTCRNAGAWTESLLLAAIVAICIGKGLKPESDPKPWLRAIPRRIMAEAGPGGAPILISDLDDLRPAYFAGARHLKLCRDGEVARRHAPDGTWTRRRCFGGELAEPDLREFSEHWRELPGAQGWDHLHDRLRELPGPVFLAIHAEDRDFRNEFARRGLPFPFRLLQVFPTRKGPPLTLYRWDDHA